MQNRHRNATNQQSLRTVCVRRNQRGGDESSSLLKNLPKRLVEEIGARGQMCGKMCVVFGIRGKGEDAVSVCVRIVCFKSCIAVLALLISTQWSFSPTALTLVVML